MKRMGRITPAINIGTDKDGVKAAREAILAILKIGSPATIDSSVKVAALHSLSALCAVTNTTISGCSFKSGSDE